MRDTLLRDAESSVAADLAHVEAIYNLLERYDIAQPEGKQQY